jgi:ferredoxin
VSEEEYNVMRVWIDRGKCIASGACAIACPEVFGQDQDGIVTLFAPDPPTEYAESVVEAANACPASVITVEPVI